MTIETDSAAHSAESTPSLVRCYLSSCTTRHVQHSCSNRLHTDHWKWFSRTFLYAFTSNKRIFPGPFMSIWTISMSFPDCLEGVGIERDKFSYTRVVP